MFLQKDLVISIVKFFDFRRYQYTLLLGGSLSAENNTIPIFRTSTCPSFLVYIFMGSEQYSWYLLQRDVENGISLLLFFTISSSVKSVASEVPQPLEKWGVGCKTMITLKQQYFLLSINISVTEFLRICRGLQHCLAAPLRMMMEVSAFGLGGIRTPTDGRPVTLRPILNCFIGMKVVSYFLYRIKFVCALAVALLIRICVKM